MTTQSETTKIETPTPKYKLGTVVKYFDQNRRGILHYGEIVLIQITKTGVVYQTQDHIAVKESDIKAEFYEMPF